MVVGGAAQLTQSVEEPAHEINVQAVEHFTSMHTFNVVLKHFQHGTVQDKAGPSHYRNNSFSPAVWTEQHEIKCLNTNKGTMQGQE